MDPIYVYCCGMPLNGSHDHNKCGPPEHANDCGCDECEQRWGDPDDARCHYCGGDGDVWGSELGDPLWYDVNELYSCPCCNGSGKAKDCTFW